MKESSLPTDNLNRTEDLAEARSRHQLGARRFAVGLTALSLVLVASVALATGIGRMDVGWGAIANVVLGKLGFHTGAVDRTTEVVVWGIRLSRIVLSGLVGASLATAGVIFQGLLLNPLADPFTLGVSTGAAFGVALLVMLGVGGSFLSLSPLPLGALAGALGAMAAVMVRISERMVMRLFMPRPSSPSRWASGMRQSLKAISQMGVVRVPRRSKALPQKNPGVSLGTKKKLSPRNFFSGSVCIRTV